MSQLVGKIVEGIANAVKEAVKPSDAKIPKVAKGTHPTVDVGAKVDPVRFAAQKEARLFEDVHLPYQVNRLKRQEEEEEQKEDQEGRGDLMQLELKQHLAQLKTPGLSVKKQKREYGKRIQDRKNAGNLSAVLYNLVRSLLHIFPWFFNYIKGFVVIRTTKQS